MQAFHRGRGANGTSPCDHMLCGTGLNFCADHTEYISVLLHQPTSICCLLMCTSLQRASITAELDAYVKLQAHAATAAQSW